MENIYVSPTDAKEVALYFCEAKQINPSQKGVMPSAINNAKRLLADGWSVDEIMETIDYVLNTNPSVYSLGYLSFCIESVQEKIQKKRSALIDKAAVQQATQRAESEVKEIEYDARRNDEKFNTKSSIRKKRNFDLPW